MYRVTSCYPQSVPMLIVSNDGTRMLNVNQKIDYRIISTVMLVPFTVLLPTFTDVFKWCLSTVSFK